MNQRVTKLRVLQFLLALAVVLIAAQAFAENDPPGRAARLAYINGSVSFQPGGVDDWALASVNRPLTTADRVWADSNSRAEISFGDGVARMDSQTSVTLTNVSDNTVQLELDQGTLNVHIRRLEGGEVYEVDTPNVAFMLQEGGDYRFDVDPNGDTTTVTVRHGEGDGTGNGPSVRVHSGDQVTFSGGNSMEHRRNGMPDRDGFDDWCRTRDERQDRSASAQYVPAGMVGYEDLDDYGGWRPDPGYGPVWYPRVNPGWSPYHYGHWAWVEPWGWTWVDDAPWGFAPFHYGRWVYVGGAWGWCPGPRPVVGVAYVRPVYAPALVAFIGGDHFSIGVSFGGGGGVGWVPLGWGEPYYPAYHVSPTYVRNVNVTNTRITNVTNITNNYTVINNSSNTRITNVRYVNQNVQGAVVAAPRTAFTGGQPIARVGAVVPRDQAARAQLSASPDVAPSRQSVLGGRPPAQMRPPAAALSRTVITRTAPPPPPARFDAKEPLLQRNAGRPLTATQTESLPRVQRPAPRVVNAPAQGNAVNPGANRPGQPAGPAANPATTRTVPRPPQNENRQGPGPGSFGATTNRVGPGRQPEVNQPANRGPQDNRGNDNGQFTRPQNNVPRPPATAGPSGNVQRDNSPNNSPANNNNDRFGSNDRFGRQNNNVPRPSNPPDTQRPAPGNVDRPAQRQEAPANVRPSYTPPPQRQEAPANTRPSYTPPPQREAPRVAPPPPTRQENQRANPAPSERRDQAPRPPKQEKQDKQDKDSGRKEFRLR